MFSKQHPLIVFIPCTRYFTSIAGSHRDDRLSLASRMSHLEVNESGRAYTSAWYILLITGCIGPSLHLRTRLLALHNTPLIDKTHDPSRKDLARHGPSEIWLDKLPRARPCFWLVCKSCRSPKRVRTMTAAFLPLHQVNVRPGMRFRRWTV